MLKRIADEVGYGSEVACRSPSSRRADHRRGNAGRREDDRVFFRNRLRLTTRVGAALDGKVWFDPKPTTYWTYAWTYEW